MVLRASIAKASAASENFWDAQSHLKFVENSFFSQGQKLSRGDRTEREALLWLVKSGLRIVSHRLETPFAEIDILAMRPGGGLVLYEVKSSFWPDDRGLGLGFRQKQRLEKSAYWITCESSRAVEVLLLGPSTRSGQFLEVPIF